MAAPRPWGATTKTTTDRGHRALATLAVTAALATAACTSSAMSVIGHTTAPTSTAPASSEPHLPASSAAAPAAAGPATGGVEFLHLYQQLVAARVEPLNEVDASARTRDLSAAVTAVRKIRDAEYAFDTAARKVTLAPAASSDFTALLTDENTLIADLDKAAAATTADQFSSAYSAVQADGQKTNGEEFAVCTDLDVATSHPTQHLAPHDLPPQSGGSRPFGTENGNGARAGYVSGGYQLQVDNGPGSVFEDMTPAVHLTDTSVTADVTMTGRSTTAYVACRSDGTGTQAGRGYYLGISSDGSFWVQIVDSAGRSNVKLAGGTSSSIHSGDGARNVLRGDCVDHYLTLFVNSQPLVQVYDDTLSSGNVGVGESVNGGPGSVLYSGFSAFGTAGS